MGALTKIGAVTARANTTEETLCSLADMAGIHRIDGKRVKAASCPGPLLALGLQGLQAPIDGINIECSWQGGSIPDVCVACTQR
jgi:hypothetical protein